MKGLAYLLAVNVETVCLVIGAWLIGDYLNEHFPRDFSWSYVTGAVATVVILHSWYAILRLIIRAETKKG